MYFGLVIINFHHTGTFAHGCMPEEDSINSKAASIISNPPLVPTAVEKIILNRHICKTEDFDHYMDTINSKKFDLDTATTVVNWRQ